MIFQAIPQLSHFGRHRACCNSVFYRAVSMRQLEYIIEVDSNSIACIWTFGLLLGKPLRLMENIGVVPVYKNAVHVKIVHLLQCRAGRKRLQCTVMRHVSSIETALRQSVSPMERRRGARTKGLAKASRTKEAGRRYWLRQAGRRRHESGAAQAEWAQNSLIPADTLYGSAYSFPTGMPDVISPSFCRNRT